jgi:ribosomal protein S18 acetylase RimI-like enzyme
MEYEQVKKLNNKDARDVARLHLSILSESFLNNLGVEFLRTLYEEIPENTNNFFSCFKDQGRIVGYLVGTKTPNIFLSKILKKRFCEIFFNCLMNFLKNPKSFICVVQHISGFLCKTPNTAPELYFLCVDPLYQRKNIGSNLTHEFEKWLSLQNIHQFVVGTHKDNSHSNDFYKKIGLSYFKEETLFGNSMIYYSKSGF